jgi:regulator of protease activity HflC (stomatin/prohibitin superfamily)
MRWILVSACALLGMAGWRHIPAGTVAAVHGGGRYRRTLNAGWHWLWPVREQLGRPVDLIGHHLDVRTDSAQAELYFQILDPDQAGAVLDEVDELVSRQTQDALSDLSNTHPENLKYEINRRVAQLGLRVVRCSSQPV